MLYFQRVIIFLCLLSFSAYRVNGLLRNLEVASSFTLWRQNAAPASFFRSLSVAGIDLLILAFSKRFVDSLILF